MPDTNVSEQRTLATKPVATTGTLPARAADHASAATAVAAATIRIVRRRIIGFLRNRASARWVKITQAARECLPVSENGLGESSPTLADSKKTVLLQLVANQAAGTLSFLYSVGVTPVVALKARLNGPSDWKPASSAIVVTGTSACAGSASAALASSIR